LKYPRAVTSLDS